MSALYQLDIITPERQFYSGQVEEVVIDNPGGKMGVLAGHVPMVAAVAIGEITIKNQEGEWLTCFTSDGFMEVRPDNVVIMAQVVEWPGEIDERRANEARAKAEEQMRQKQSIQEYHKTMTSLARAMARLRVKGSINID